jgi:hypothetical protein
MSNIPIKLTGDLVRDFEAYFNAALGNSDAEVGALMTFCDDNAAKIMDALKREKILTDAMCEIYATIQGRSLQSVRSIVDGCRAELCRL